MCFSQSSLSLFLMSLLRGITGTVLHYDVVVIGGVPGPVGGEGDRDPVPRGTGVVELVEEPPRVMLNRGQGGPRNGKKERGFTPSETELMGMDRPPEKPPPYFLSTRVKKSVPLYDPQ